MKKRILSLLLVLALVLPLCPAGVITVPVSAATSGTTGDCTWQLDGTELTISGNGAMGDYGMLSADWGRNITSVTIKEGVTTIGNWAFGCCEGLASIVIPNSVTRIGNYAFVANKNLTSVALGNSVITIGNAAFEGCTSLTSIIIPNSVTNIDQKTFNNCQNLVSITFGKGITTIDKEAFYGCNKLRDVWYLCTRSDVANISIGDLNYSLTSATWHYLDLQCDEICNDCGKVYPYAHILDHPCDPDCNDCGFVREEPHTFGGDCGAICKECGFVRTPLSEHIYDNVADDTCNTCGFFRELPYDAYGTTGNCFWYTIGTKLTIGGGGTMANYSPFSPAPWGRAITEVVIENGVTAIGQDAFSDCKSLTSIALSKTISRVSDYAFDGCTALSDIWYGGTSTQKEAISISDKNTALTLAAWHYDSCLANAPAYTHAYDNACDADCGICGQIREASHIYDNVCDADCNECGHSRAVESHFVVRSPHILRNSASHPFRLSNGWYTSTNKADSSSATFTLIAGHTCTLAVHYMVSSEANCDELIIKTCNTTLVVSGSISEQVFTVSLKEGDFLSITYSKDDSGSAGSDSAYFKIDSCLCESYVLADSVEPTCGSPVICSGCGTVVKPASGHRYDNASDPDCNNCGHTRFVIGDVDGDGEIGDWDGVVLARYLAGWDVEIENPEALDLDGDGEITDWDGVLLDRTLAGWSL